MGGAFTNLTDRPAAWSIPGDLVGGEVGTVVEVIRLDALDAWLVVEAEPEALTAVIRAVTDLWDEPLDEVHDVPQIVNAVLAAGYRRTREDGTAMDRALGALARADAIQEGRADG